MRKTKTRQELAEEYGISRKTFARRLDGMGIQLSRDRGVLMPVDVLRVYKALGFPEKIGKEEKAQWMQEMSAQWHKSGS